MYTLKAHCLKSPVETLDEWVNNDANENFLV